MLTEDPEEMMRTFHKQAKEGCLLGITVTGDTEIDNYLYALPTIIRKKRGLPSEEKKIIKNHVLFNRLEELGQSTGWEHLSSW
jgi:hypothetical protein